MSTRGRGAPTTPSDRRAAVAALSLLDTARARARAAYATGDPRQSAFCIEHHLETGQAAELARSERYPCPVCGHLLKDRSLLPREAS